MSRFKFRLKNERFQPPVVAAGQRTHVNGRAFHSLKSSKCTIESNHEPPVLCDVTVVDCENVEFQDSKTIRDNKSAVVGNLPARAVTTGLQRRRNDLILEYPLGCR